MFKVTVNASKLCLSLFQSYNWPKGLCSTLSSLSPIPSRSNSSLGLLPEAHHPLHLPFEVSRPHAGEKNQAKGPWAAQRNLNMDDILSYLLVDIDKVVAARQTAWFCCLKWSLHSTAEVAESFCSTAIHVKVAKWITLLHGHMAWFQKQRGNAKMQFGLWKHGGSFQNHAMWLWSEAIHYSPLEGLEALQKLVRKRLFDLMVGKQT